MLYKRTISFFQLISFFRNGLVVPPTMEVVIVVGSVKSAVGDFSDGFPSCGDIQVFALHSITNNHVGCATILLTKLPTPLGFNE